MAPGSQTRFLANWDSQARKGILELIVMSALFVREFYGYELVEHILKRSEVAVNDGTLYAILSRLKAEGLVRTRWEAPEKGPARKYYSLTPEGRAALRGMERQWQDIVRGVKAVARGEGPSHA